MKTITASEVVDAVRDWGRARLLILAVKDARNSCRCEIEYRGTLAPDDPSEPACWMTNEWNHCDGPTVPQDWCDPCLERHKWHMALIATRRIHGARLRRLQRIATGGRINV